MTATLTDRAADEREIREHIERIFRAYVARDRKTVRETHSRNWRGFIRASKSVIRGVDAYMREAEAILSGEGDLIGHEMLEYDVHFREGIALVSYVARVDWRLEGVESADVLRVLDVYAKEDGRWNQIASNVTPHPERLAAAQRLPRPLVPSERASLLKAREAVWRSWFGNDRPTLERLVPEDAIAINPGEDEWLDGAGVLTAFAIFQQSKPQLRALEFPRTEIRAYGDVAIIYSLYRFDVEVGSTRRVVAGRCTEVFVKRNGCWVNPGWHLDSGR